MESGDDPEPEQNLVPGELSSESGIEHVEHRCDISATCSSIPRFRRTHSAKPKNLGLQRESRHELSQPPSINHHTRVRPFNTGLHTTTNLSPCQETRYAGERERTTESETRRGCCEKILPLPGTLVPRHDPVHKSHMFKLANLVLHLDTTATQGCHETHPLCRD